MGRRCKQFTGNVLQVTCPSEKLYLDGEAGKSTEETPRGMGSGT
ncbi:MAG TPA: hypothetical protein VMW72_20000 [Sedimentisphaerales bacterium]|nr:hypothetical protein [Sedimentisphaerales bacterium]